MEVDVVTEIEIPRPRAEVAAPTRRIPTNVLDKDH
jgi:hypothetical protein